MSRHLIVIRDDQDRARARTYINSAPVGTRLDIKAAKRSLAQNDALWAMLTDIAAQKEHNGRKYKPDIWKLLFMDGLGREVQWIPSLDLKTVVPLGRSSSDLSRDEMSELLAFIDAWCATNGVKLHGPHEAVS